MTPAPQRSALARLGTTLRDRVMTGVLVLVPLAITLWVLKVIFLATAGVLRPILRFALGEMPPPVITLVSFVTMLALLYIVGAVAAHFLGRRLIALGEAFLLRVPLVKTIYSAVKQIVDAFSPSQQKAFQRVVLVEFPRRGLLCIGFVAGNAVMVDGTPYLKVFIPTTPNPTTGFLEFVPLAETRDTPFSVEEAVKIVMSGGILCPERIETRTVGAPTTATPPGAAPA